MRNYESVISEAWLLASAPQQVVEFLEKRAAKLDNSRFDLDADEELEHGLLGRSDPLANLALAKYGFCPSVVRKLFEISEGTDGYSRAVRFAVLSNQCITSGLLTPFPECLFETKELVGPWLASTSIDEIYVLFENPSLATSFLRDFLEGGTNWQAVDEERRLAAITALSKNKRMKTPYDDRVMDGYAEYSHSAVFNAAWKLAETAPVTEEWAARLSWLYHGLQRDAFSIKDPLILAQRWFPDPLDAEAQERERDHVKSGHLSLYQGVREGLATLALKHSSALLPQLLLKSEDVALRCAAYAAGTLTPTQIAAAYEQDSELAFRESVHNPNIWRTTATREALRNIAWAVVNDDQHSDMFAANLFNDIKEDMARKHPDWFAEEDYKPEIEDGDEPATKEDLQRATEAMANMNVDLVEHLRQTLSGLNTRIGWIWWFSLGAAAASIVRHF